MKSVPIERLHDLFRLDAETGRLYWKVDRLTGRGKGRLSVRAGEEAGYVTDTGYRKTCVDYIDLPVHRIVFAMANGHWPKAEVDHINGDRLDNRPCNLRNASHQQQMHNIKRNPASGLKGAYPSRRGKWVSKIMVGRKNQHLGTFPDAESAHRAYCEAAKRLHGEFARTA